MTIAAIADQHGSLPTIPECDMVVLAGDITNGNPFGPRDGSDEAWWSWLHADFAKWILNGPPAFGIAGNHDTCIERFGQPSIKNFTYLQDSGVDHLGLKIWGTPWVRKWDTLAFQLTEDELAKRFEMIPDGIDILISHGPPLGHCDSGVGSKSLYNSIVGKVPFAVVCGHIHDARGESALGSSIIVNASGGFKRKEIFGGKFLTPLEDLFDEDDKPKVKSQLRRILGE